MNLWAITVYFIVAAVLLFGLMSVYTWHLRQVIKAYEKDYPKHEMFDIIEPKWR